MALVDLKSNLSWYGTNPPAVNYFPDDVSGASGFTDNMFKDGSKKPSQFTVDADVLKVPRTNTKYPEYSGDGTLANQLGIGSPFRYLKNGAVSTKVFSTNGANSKSTYESSIVNGQSHLLIKATEQNSTSAIDEEYKKFNLRNDSYNPTYIAQPFIVRGIQRKGKETPQYWGFGSKSGFDDGLIRGGVVTVADRIVADTVRIAKFMASPKGLLWVVKQVGLGLTNPKVETSPIAPLRQSRIHSGITSLLSVPGTPLGLHFTTHGLPFANEVASYGNVQLAKQLYFDIVPALSNRLISLKKDLLTPKHALSSLPANGLQALHSLIKIQKGSVITSLSGLAGPQSVYGIGLTTIKRTTDTFTDSIHNASQYGYVYPYSITNQYASRLSGKTISSTKSDDVNAATKDQIRHSGMIEKSNPKIDTTKQPTFKNYENKTPGNDLGADISNTNSKDSVYGKSDTINEYITLAYGKIPKSTGLGKFNDFRSDIANSAKSLNLSQASQLGFGNTEKNDYYTTNNLETMYGFGRQGEVGADRTNPYDMGLGDKSFNSTNPGSDANRTIFITDAFRGDRINAIDVAIDDNVKLDNGKKTGLDYSKIYPNSVNDFVNFVFSDAEYGKNVIVFRATLTGFEDSFTPNWQRIDIMGRPDGAYLYSSFDRSISFTFTVAATSRAEMIPMWRKLNYLSTYTMPNYGRDNSQRASGPFMRITIGDMFNATPGFIESLSYSIPEDATWDIAEDKKENPDAKQLPMMVEASVTFKIIADYRPRLLGRSYSLSNGGSPALGEGQWLGDSAESINYATAEENASK